MARHAQINENNKYAVSLQYRKKEVSGEVDFLHAEKHETFLQIKTMIIIGIFKHSQNFQNSTFVMYLQYFRKEFRSEVKFLHADKHQNFYKLSSFCLIEVF